MNCKVRADLPTPPLPTMMTLWRPVCFSFAFDIVFVDAKCEFDETDPNTSDKKPYKPLPTEASSRKRDRCLGWTFLWRHRRQRMRIDEWGETKCNDSLLHNFPKITQLTYWEAKCPGRRNCTSVFVFRQVLNNGIELVITLTYRGMVVGSEC